MLPQKVFEDSVEEDVRELEVLARDVHCFLLQAERSKDRNQQTFSDCLHAAGVYLHDLVLYLGRFNHPQTPDFVKLQESSVSYQERYLALRVS